MSFRDRFLKITLGFARKSEIEDQIKHYSQLRVDVRARCQLQKLARLR